MGDLSAGQGGRERGREGGEESGALVVEGMTHILRERVWRPASEVRHRVCSGETRCAEGGRECAARGT